MFSFDKVVGNHENVLNMQMSVKNSRLFHSYIIHGEKEIGKLFITNCFAKMIQCENKSSCGKCYSCNSFESGNNPDIVYVRPAKTNNLGVDDIRQQVKSQSQIKPYFCRHKIFILEDADKMTVAAQNALLKILEEPPDFVIFFLLGESVENFLPTVISRCVKIKINPVTNEQVCNFLECKNVEPSFAKICAAYSQGNIGRAMKLVDDKNFISMRDKIIDLARKLKVCDSANALLLVSEFEKFKDNIDLVLDVIYFWYNDLFLYQQVGDESLLCNVDKLQFIIEDASDFQNLCDKIDTVAKTKKYLRHNTNFKLTLSVMLLELSGV